MVEEVKGVVSMAGRFTKGMFGSIYWASAENCERHESSRWKQTFPVILLWTRAGVAGDLQLVKWAPITSRMQALHVQSFIARMLALPSLRLSLRTSYSEDQECL